MFIKNRNLVITRTVLALVLIAGVFGVQPARAATIDFGWANDLGSGYGFDIYVDVSGNIYSTGSSDGAIFINKLDNDGNLVWFKSLVGSGRGFSLAVDSNGNVFATGPFQGTVDFDPGPDTYNLTSLGGMDVFVVKLDQNGHFVWAKKIGGASVDEGYKIAVGHGGDVYITGTYSGTVDFDPGASTNNLISAGGGDVFVCKLDTDGHLIWAKSMGGSGGEIGMSIALDSTGNIYTTGGFSGTADFDPGVGVYNLVSGGGEVDGFISKLDGTGEFIWAKIISITGAKVGIEIALDDLGNVFATGVAGPSSSYDVFITKLNTNGDLAWAQTLGDSSMDYGLGIDLDQFGNVFTTGSFAGTVDFDPGTGTSNLTSAGADDVFISKFDTNGDFVWAKKIGGVGYDSGDGLVVDGIGNVYLTGAFSDTVDFDPDTETYNLTSVGSTDAFVSKFAFAPQIHYVKWDATGANDGSSWIDAYTDLQYALSATSAGDEIWVAAGTYYPTSDTDRTISFELKNGVAIYGGFAGTETLLSERDWEMNVTILSGDLNDDDIGFTNNDENSYHVVVNNGTNDTTVLDGFDIVAGNANHTSNPHESGGGLYNENSTSTLTNLNFVGNFGSLGGGMANNQSSPILTNITFSGNSATEGGGIDNRYDSSPTLTNVTFDNNQTTVGGGMFNWIGCNPILTNVTFHNNSATIWGGGMLNYENGNPSLTNVIFSNNSAEGGGGLANVAGNTPILTNVTFSGNSATFGGGIQNSVGGNPILTNVTFEGNSATNAGGGMFNDSSNPTLTNVTFLGNSAITGGGIYNKFDSHPNLINVILWGDTATDGPEIYNDNFATPLPYPTISYSIVQGSGGSASWDLSLGTDNGNNLDTNPMLGTLGNYGGYTETIPLLPNSSAIDAGDDGVCPDTDQHGVTRPQGSHCDIGAYEYTPDWTGQSWYGVVSIEADQAVVAVARPHVGNEVASYDGFSSGSLNSYVPMLFRDAFGGSYDSALYVQNVDDTNTANLTFKFYDNAGNLSCTKTDSLTPQASRGYWLPSLTCDTGSLPAGWVGGVKVESDQPIVAVGRPHVGGEVMTYNGFSAGSTTSYIPMLFKGAFGGSYNAAFYIQNTHASNTANLTIEYYDNTGNLNCTKTDSIAPLASQGYWTPSTTCDTGSLPAGWVGGVVVTSDQPIVAVGRPHIGSQVTTYISFTGGSLSSYIPMLFKGAFGGSYNAAFYIQNTHASNTANLTIEYYDNTGNLNCTKTDSIAPLASQGYWTPSTTCDTGSLPAGWVGGVVVTSDHPIVAVGRPHIGSQVTTYNGFTGGSPNTYLPMLFKDAFGGSYDSALYIQNTEASSATVTLEFYDSNGTLSCIKNTSIPPGATSGFWLPSLMCD